MKENNGEKSSVMLTRTTKRKIFYYSLMFLPILQFCIFYIYVNLNSILLAFQETDVSPFKTHFASDIFVNFKTAFSTLAQYSYMIKNSLILFVCTTVVGLSLSMVFSFYIYKELPASGLFKVILFLPKIIPTVVFAILFKYVATDVYIGVVKALTGAKVDGLLAPATQFQAVLFYNVWISFGINVILFTGAMSGINEAIVESAQIDGASMVREFISITVPMIFPTLITFIVVGLAQTFTHQMSLYTLFGSNGTNIATIGYYIYLNAQQSDVIAKSGYLSYHVLSAIGLIFTVIMFTVTIVVRTLLTKYGPSEK